MGDSDANGNGNPPTIDSNSSSTAAETSVSEHTQFIIDREIAYCRYGVGPTNILFVPGGVGCYAKDYPECVLQAFDPNLVTIICIDPPGYGRSRPPDRCQSVNRCKMDAPYCIKLMQELSLLPFAIVGWSEGGRTAVHVIGQANSGAAAKSGQPMVTHGVLLSTSTTVDARGDMAFKGMRNTTQWLPAAREIYLKHYSEEFLTEQWAALCDVVSKVYKDLGGRFPSDSVLPSIKVPILIVNGGMDRFVLDPKLMTSKLVKSKIEVHAQAGHDVHIKYPRWFATKVMGFIKDAK